MKRDLLRAYAAVVTGLLADAVTAAIMGGCTNYEIIGIAFMSTGVFFLVSVGFLALTEPREEEERDGSRAEGRKRQTMKKKIKKHLPGCLRVALMRHAWRVKQRQRRTDRIERIKQSGPQIYTLRGDVLKIPVSGDPDMMEYVPVWTARREEN